MTTTQELMRDASELRMLAALRSPAMMGRYLRGQGYRLPAHVKVIDDELVKLGNGTDRLLITTPPQIGKSALVSELLPFWWLANHPAHEIAIASYAASLAVKKGRAVRRMVAEHGADFGLHLQPGAQEVYDWSLTTGGGVRSTGVGGGLTGHSVTGIGLVDDPHKDRAEADSPLMRERVWEWWSSVFLSRLRPHNPVCLVLTRWSEDDLAARVLHHEGRVEEGGRWHVVHLEAIASGTVTDPLGRQPGEPLTHPALDDDDREELLAHWDDKRRTSTPRDWAALYQGSPTPPEGGLVTDALMRERTHIDPPPAIRSAVAVDPSGGGHGDTAGIVAGHLADDSRVYITHDRTGFMASDEWARRACLLAVEVDADRIVFEKNYGGDLVPIAIRAAWDALVRDDLIDSGRPRPYLHGVIARKGKLLRAEPVGQAFTEDLVRLGAQLPELIAEFVSWRPEANLSPGRIDASVYLVRELQPRPGAAQRGMRSAATVRRDQFPKGTQAPRRPY